MKFSKVIKEALRELLSLLIQHLQHNLLYSQMHPILHSVQYSSNVSTKNGNQCLTSQKSLALLKKKYGTYDREPLAVYKSIKLFRHMVEGRHFMIYTDHKPITFAFHQKSDKCTPREFRHLYFISQFSTDIRHISGCDNTIANALSRIEQLSIGLDFDALVKAQKNDLELQDLMKKGTALQLKMIQMPGTKISLLCDLSTSITSPFVTK